MPSSAYVCVMAPSVVVCVCVCCVLYVCCSHLCVMRAVCGMCFRVRFSQCDCVYLPFVTLCSCVHLHTRFTRVFVSAPSLCDFVALKNRIRLTHSLRSCVVVYALASLVC